MASCAGSRRWRRPSGWRVSACRCRARCRATCRRARGAGRRPRGAAHLRQGRGGTVTEGDTLTQTDLAGDAGRDPPARRRRILPGHAGAHAVRPGRADGRQPAARSVAQRRAAGGAAGRARAYGRRKVYVAPPPTAGAAALAGWNGQAPGGAGAGRFRRHLPAWSRSTARRARPPAACRWASSSARARSCPAPASCSARHARRGGGQPGGDRQSRQRRGHVCRRGRRLAVGGLGDRLRSRARRSRRQAVRRRAALKAAGRAATSTPSPARRACAAAARPAAAPSIRPAPGWR